MSESMMRERVWAANYATELWLTETVSPEGDPRLEVTADVGDQETTIVLDADGVRNLRLLLVRYEREQAAKAGLCRSCDQPFAPSHDVSAPGPTSRHPFVPA